jgi:hypothetical protein
MERNFESYTLQIFSLKKLFPSLQIRVFHSFDVRATKKHILINTLHTHNFQMTLTYIQGEREFRHQRGDTAVTTYTC